MNKKRTILRSGGRVFAKRSDEGGSARPSQTQAEYTQYFERMELPKPAHERKTAGRWIKNMRRRNGHDAPESAWLVERKKPRSFILKVVLTTVFMFFVLALCVVFGGAGAMAGFAGAYINATPPFDIGLISDQDEVSMIYDANGDLITTFLYVENREWAKSEDIPDMLKNAFIAVEDVRFYEHNGIDLKRLFGVVIGVLGNDYDGGGSTITQQLIKIQVLGNEQSYKRKIQEAYLAMQLEEQYNKDQILEAYLNAIHLGDSNYGVKAAAEDYFGKSMEELTIRECAMLAGITQNPNGYNPRKNMYSENRDFSKTDERTNTVLRRMYSAGFITQEQLAAALDEKVEIQEVSKVKQIYDMPYFVEYAIDNVITHMLRQENLQDNKTNRTKIERKLRTGGYKIYTTVDPNIQNTVQQTLSSWDKYPKLRNPANGVVSESNADGSVIETIQPQAAAVVLDHKTGQIKALVGGRDEPTAAKLWNRAVQSRMEVGSSIKPLSIYGPALDLGASPASVYLNYAVPIEGYTGTRGYPNGGLSKQGPVTMRAGVRQSLNVVAARTLFESVGLERSKEYLINLGIDASGIKVDGAGLALGTSGISPLEMAAAYGCIANGGTYIEPVAFTKVVDRNGNVVLDAASVQIKRQVFQPSTAWMLTDMLEEAVNSGTGTRAKISNMTVAGKTGTNSDYRSVYFAGYTPYYTSSLWIGHDKQSEGTKLVSGATGGLYAAPLWQEYMNQIHDGLQNRDIIDKQPSELGLVQRRVCSVTGLLATDACSSDSNHKPVTDWFALGQAPATRCDVHVSVEICADSGKLATPYCPEGSKKTGSVVLPRSNSMFSDISNDMLASTLPGCIIGLTKNELLTLPEYDTRYSQYYCTIHTNYQSSSPLDGAVDATAARSLIAEANALINSGELSSGLSVEISSAVENLQNLLDSGVDASVYADAYAHLEALVGIARLQTGSME